MPRPRITDEELQLIYRLRERHKALETECKEKGVPLEDVKHYWYKSEQFSMFVKPQVKTFEEVAADLVEQVKRYAPVYPDIKRGPVKDGHLLVLNPADVHIGKLAVALETGDSYNREIAVRRVREGVAGILEKAVSYNIERILLIIGNDKLHVDSQGNTTTKGTRQDVDGMWYEHFMTAQALDVEILETLLTVAPVHVQYDRSNHDDTLGFCLAQVLQAWFRNHKDVTFDVSPAPRKYHLYGKNLIGSTHGDKTKPDALHRLMTEERPGDWGVCKHRYFYAGHVHHKVSKDVGSVCVEYMRSPSGTDSWHSGAGYSHSPKAIEGFIHHAEYGQIARLTHLF